MYACGLRISEATTLEVGAIDRTNQVLRVIGKGNKERLVPSLTRLPWDRESTTLPVKYRHADNEDVSWITNVDADGKIDWFGVRRATDWHTDSTFEDELPLLAILHAREVPSERGGTLFADMRAAYARLPEQRQP